MGVLKTPIFYTLMLSERSVDKHLGEEFLLVYRGIGLRNFLKRGGMIDENSDFGRSKNSIWKI